MIYNVSYSVQHMLLIMIPWTLLCTRGSVYYVLYIDIYIL